MKTSSLLKLIKYGEYPTAVHLELANGKRARHKYEHFTSFLDHCRSSTLLQEAEYDDVVVQKSLLDGGKPFIMIYGREKGVENERLE